MIQLACLGRGYKEQLETRPDALQGVDLVWQGTDLTQLLGLKDKIAPTVLLVDLETLDGAEAAGALKALQSRFEPEMILLVYRFARREEIAGLAMPGEADVRTLQGPLTLTTLRSQILSLIVRDLLGGSRPSPRPAAETCPECGQPLR